MWIGGVLAARRIAGPVAARRSGRLCPHSHLSRWQARVRVSLARACRLENLMERVATHPALSAARSVPDAATDVANRAPLQETDGFQLVIDALKLNGIDTIFGVPGIPITDLTRRMQKEGLRVISFRHEQNAGYAASIAGFMTQKPGICLTVSAPGFLNGLTALANATTNCFPMILISGSSEREVVDLQQVEVHAAR